MDLREFYELGFLQEANRLFFHPRGLALEMNFDDETDEVTISGIWDYRDDEEGIMFSGWGDDAVQRRDNIEEERRSHIMARMRMLNNGSEIQEVGHVPSALPEV
jgi:hypothetical protein